MIGAFPFQVPVLAVSVDPSCAFPEIAGSPVFAGAPGFGAGGVFTVGGASGAPVTEAVSDETVVFAPSVSLAVTATRIVWLTSALPS